jgi:hypothetical protein
VVDLAEEAGVEQLLDLFTIEVLSLHGLLPQLLMERPHVDVNLEFVLDHLPRDPGHVRWLPGEHVDISPEESDECKFLFAPSPASMRVV